MRYIVSIIRITYHPDQQISSHFEKLIRMNYDGELLQTKNVGLVDKSNNSIVWNDNFKIVLQNKWKQLSIEFEIFKQHSFGFNKQELLGVLKGIIDLRYSNVDKMNREYDVFNLKRQRVGRLVVNMQIKSPFKSYLRSKSFKTQRIMTENPQIKINSIQNRSIITILSIITNFKEQINLTNCYATLKVGPRVKSTTTLKKRQNIPIWVQAFTFKRQSQQNLQISIMTIDSSGSQMRIGYGSVNLDQIQHKKHVISHKMNLFNDQNDSIGSCFIDIKAKVIGQYSKRQQTQKSIEQQSTQIISLSRRSSSHRNLSSHFNILQQLHSSRISSSKLQKSIIHSNRNIFMSKSQRFKTSSICRSPQSGYLNLFGKNISDFNLTKKKHGNIGHGKKTDFCKYKQYLPGVGEYKLPSLFDRYK